MWMPGKKIDEATREMFITALNDMEVKKEIKKQVDETMREERFKNQMDHTAATSAIRGTAFRGSNGLSYDALTSGNVNLQARMAASGFDVYGRTILGSTKDVSNNDLYKSMKNRIIYGAQPAQGFRHYGSRTVR